MPADTRYRTLLILMGLVGAIALTVQTVLLRELMVVTWGNELVFGIGLSFWLTGVFCGALTGSFVVRHRNIVLRTTLLIVSCLPLLGVGAVVWIRCLHLITGTPSGQLPAYGVVVAAAGLVFLLTAIPVGLTFPLLVALLQRQSENERLESATPVYVAEAVGACVMAFLLSLLLLGRLTSLTLIAGTGLLIIPAVLFSPYRHERGVSTWMLLFGLLLVVIPFLLTTWSVDNRWRSVSAGNRIVERETPYQLVSLGELGGQYQLMSNGRIQEVFPDRVSERVMVAGISAQCPDAHRILIVGPVPPSLAVTMQSALPADLISIVLDPRLNRLMEIPPDSGTGLDRDNCRRITGDVRTLLRNPQQNGLNGLDLVVVHGSEPTGTLGNRLLTLEFMQRLSRSMEVDGVLALSIPDTVNYTAGDVAGVGSLIASTVQSVFPHVVIVPGSPHWLFASRSRGVLVTEQETIVRRIRALGPDWRREALMVGGDYEPGRMGKTRAALLGHEKETNRDDRPILLRRYARLTGWYSGGGISVWLDLLVDLPWIWVLLPLLLTGIGRVGGNRVRLYLPVGIMGFTAMSIMLVLIYMYQVHAGSVYRQIALLSGLFMTGLPLGAWAVRRWQATGKKDQAASLMLPLLLIITLLALLLALWHRGAMHPLILLVAGGFGGFVAGTVFPLAMTRAGRLDRDVPSGSGLVDAADHFGGAVGALLVASFMIPSMGVTGSLLLLIAVSGAGLLVLPGDH